MRKYAFPAEMFYLCFHLSAHLRNKQNMYLTQTDITRSIHRLASVTNAFVKIENLQKLANVLNQTKASEKQQNRKPISGNGLMTSHFVRSANKQQKLLRVEMKFVKTLEGLEPLKY
jgi:hypothetical protein